VARHPAHGQPQQSHERVSGLRAPGINVMIAFWRFLPIFSKKSLLNREYMLFI
jgi:hypothetical protein